MNDGCLVDDEGYGVDVKRKNTRLTGLFRKSGRQVQQVNALAAAGGKDKTKSPSKSGNAKSTETGSKNLTVPPTASGSATVSASVSASASEDGGDDKNRDRKTVNV